MISVHKLSLPVPLYICLNSIAAICFLSDDIHDYHFVSQGKVTVASIDDAEEMQFTDVSCSESPKCVGLDSKALVPSRGQVPRPAVMRHS